MSHQVKSYRKQLKREVDQCLSDERLQLKYQSFNLDFKQLIKNCKSDLNEYNPKFHHSETLWASIKPKYGNVTKS